MRLSGQDKGIVSPRHPAQQGFSPLALKVAPAFVEALRDAPAILDLDRTRDNAPHITEG